MKKQLFFIGILTVLLSCSAILIAKNNTNKMTTVPKRTVTKAEKVTVKAKKTFKKNESQASVNTVLEGWNTSSTNSHTYKIKTDYNYIPSSDIFELETEDNVTLLIANNDIKITTLSEFYPVHIFGPYPFSEYGEIGTDKTIPLTTIKMLLLFAPETFQNQLTSWTNKFPKDSEITDNKLEEQETSYFEIIGDSTNTDGDILKIIDVKSYSQLINNSYYPIYLSQINPLYHSYLNNLLNSNIYWIGQIVWNETQRRVEVGSFDYTFDGSTPTGSDENLILTSNGRRHISINYMD